MVKGFDTTSSDFSKRVLDSLFSLFDPHRVQLSPEKATSYIQEWLLSRTSTSEIYSQFEHLTMKPSIALHQQCPKPLFISSTPYDGDTYFGAYEEGATIHICLNNIRNKIELK